MQSRNTSIASSGSRGFAAIIAAGANGGSKVPARWDIATEKRSTMVSRAIGPAVDPILVAAGRHPREGVLESGERLDRFVGRPREGRGQEEIEVGPPAVEVIDPSEDLGPGALREVRQGGRGED